MGENPIEKVKPPTSRSVERQAYAPDLIDALRDAQRTLRDQIAIQLLGRLALRREELRLITVSDFDLSRGTIRVHGKGNKVVVLPLGFKTLKADVEVYVVGRDPSEYLLHPRHDLRKPMDRATVHRWFKGCLERAGLPTTIKIHELRHSAADHLWRTRQSDDGAAARTALVAVDDGALPASEARGPRGGSGGARWLRPSVAL